MSSPRTATRCSSRRAPASAPRSRTPSTKAAGAKILDGPDEVWGTADMVLKVKEPDRRGVPPDARGPDPLHLPPPGGRQAPHRRADLARKVTGIAYETVQLPVRRAAAALPDVRGRRLPGAPGRRVLAAQGPGRPRRPDGWRRRRGQRQGRHHRRRRLRAERRQHRARHGRRRDPARHRPRQAADVVLALQQPGPRPGLVAAGDPAAGDGGRHGDRRRADPGSGGTEAGQQRAGLAR